MARTLKGRGYELVDFNEKADVYIVNSCSVTAKADKKSEQAIRKARNRNQQATVVMVGCYAQLQPAKIAGLEGVDLILGNDEKSRLPEYLEQFDKTRWPEPHTCPAFLDRDFFPAYSHGDRTRSFLKVQDGCDYRCSYCTIPLARGRSRNQSIASTVNQAREIAQGGVKEIILTGVNIGDFGKSTHESFTGLIRALEKIRGIERIRISSIEPNLLSDEIIDLVAGSGKFLPHFHIPLQSGSDEILGYMRRRYKREHFLRRIQSIREKLPSAFIGVDVIVGFPGEDEHRFIQTMNFLKELDVSYYHAFSFSSRPATPAYTMEKEVPANIIKERSMEVQQLAEEKKEDFYRKHLGQSRRVLFENMIQNGNIQGFTDNYIRVEIPYMPGLQGQIQEVYLQDYHKQGMIKGSLLKQQSIQA